jgi:glycosyltransferase involved in cell wall biosynthesis
LSHYTREQIQKFYGLADRVTVIPHWLRPEFRRVHSKVEARRLLGWPADEKILFTVRRHGARYGLDTAISAIAPFAAQGLCRFVLAGDGPLRSALERQVQDLGAVGRVTFPGRLSDQDLCLAYEAADLFILPTAALECFGLIILEAFSFGCPVLSTDVGAIPETMRPIMPDFVVPARSTEALARKVELFLTGQLVPPSPETLVAHVNEGYARERIAPQLVSLLEGRPADGR